MESLQLSTPRKTYNWDDCDVGNPAVNHSQNFFDIAHIKHEKLDDLESIQNKMAVADLNVSFDKCMDFLDDNDKENTQQNILTSSRIKTEFENSEQNSFKTITPIKKNSIEENSIGKENETPVAISEKEDEDIKPHVDLTETENADETKIKEKKAAPNIIPCWSSQKTIVSKKIFKYGDNGGAISKNSAAKQRTPEAYHFKDVYHNKKQEAERKRAEEERKMREFHCRPAPNFRAMHERLKANVVHKISAPITPKTLKKSLLFKQKQESMRKKLLEEEAAASAVAAASAMKTADDSRDPKVLFKEPFVPKKVQNNVLKPRPFQLQSGKRAEERKLFDAQVQLALEDKRKKEEEERKRQEEEERRELKKLATFKARPNPFK